MRKRTKLIAFLLAGVPVVLVVLLAGAYRASQHVPNFYVEALAQDRVVQEQASHEMGTRVTTLYNDVRRTGQWQALFTTEQINAWLALDVMEKHRELIPGHIHDPRIAVTPESVTLGLSYEEDNIKTVFTLGVEAYLNGPNEIAFRIRRVRAGSLPLPMNNVRDHITEIAANLNLPLRWTHVEGTPVAVVTIAPHRDADDNVLWLEKLVLREGEIYVSGRTLPPDASTEPAEVQETPATVAQGGTPSQEARRQR